MPIEVIGTNLDGQDVANKIRELQVAVNALAPPSENAGSTALDGAEIDEQGNGAIHRTVITLTDQEITLTDEAGVGQWGTLELYECPAGMVVFLGAVINAELTLVGTEWLDTAVGDVGLGTAAVTDGNALAGTEQNLIATTEIAAMVAQVGPIDAKSATGTDATASFDGTSAPVTFNLNIRIDDNAAHITATGEITGEVTILWAFIGDI